MDSPSDDEIYCPSCGERIQRTATFCRYCGVPNRKHPEYEPPTDRPSDRDDRPIREERSSDRDVDEDRRNAGWDDEPVDPGEPGDEEPADPDPWETRRARRIESGIDDEGDVDSGFPQQDGADEGAQWRKHLPEFARHDDDSALRVTGTAIGLGVGGVVLLILMTILAVNVATLFGFSLMVGAVIGTFLGQLGFAGLAFWYLNRRGLDWEQMKRYLGIRMPSLKQLGMVLGSWLVILALLLVVGIAIELLTDLLGMGEPDEPEQAIDEIISDNPLIVPVVMLFMFLVVGPCEELLFRGAIQGRLREYFSAVSAILIASALFAVIHVIALAGSLQAIMLGISVLFITSLVLGALYEYTGNIVVVSLLHGFHNSMVTLIVYIEAAYGLEEAFLASMLLF